MKSESTTAAVTTIAPFPTEGREAKPLPRAMLTEVLAGLSARPKRLSPKWFYDKEGSLLFDAICELPEYYVTRTELAILERHAGDLARLATRRGTIDVRVVEPGAGSGLKTRLLLRALGPEHCVQYAPVDIAREHLAATASAITRELPWLRVTPTCADFTAAPPRVDATLEAAGSRPVRTLVYFPGSTIGNFEPAEAARLLATFAETAGPGGLVVLGVDLKKDPATLHAAYNDARGVTAAFNRNVLVRLNRELGADFRPDAFAHYAFYEPRSGRIEMHLVSTARQTVRIAGRAFTFEEGESLHTECSYKWDLHGVARLAANAGLVLHDVFTDDARKFAVLALAVPPRD